MRLKLLGSAAGKTVPRPFCKCRVCEYAKTHGGRDRRTRTGMHVFLDGDDGVEPRYQVDLSADTGHHMIRDGFCLDQLEHVLITHDDQDHFEPDYIAFRGRIMSDREGMKHLNVYGSHVIAERLAALGLDLDSIKVSCHTVTPYEAFRMGELTVFPFQAPHGQNTFHYVVQHGGQAVLLAWDTGYYRDERIWRELANFKLDAVFMECLHLTDTRVKEKETSTHMDFTLFLEMRERLRSLGCIQHDTPYVAVHIGDNGGLLHAEGVELAAPHGVTVGFDGFELTLSSPSDRGGQP